MLRTFFVAMLALVLASGIALAGDEAKKKKKAAKKAKANTGQITKVDVEKGIITVSVKVKKNTEDKEFKVTDKTEVIDATGDAPTPVKADKVTELLKKDQFKVGATISVETEEDNTTAKKITISKGKKKKKKTDK
jgi:hypothetical protein